MRKALRKGFTLIEMLVVMILLALLVGVVFPVIVQQIEDAEPAKAANDMTNIRTAIELFQLNVRPKAYPLNLAQLAIAITTSDNYWSATTSTAQYSSGHANRWNGPYIDKNVTAGTGTAFKTGFGGDIQSELTPYDATENVPCCASPYDAANPIFLAVQITNLGEPESRAISELIDGSDVLTSGQFRRVSTVSYYLSVPVN